MSPLAHHVKRRCLRLSESGIGPNVVVAVSGGGDSVALLRLLHERNEQNPSSGWRLSVAHLDHGVRKDAAKADAEFVAALADQLNLPFDLGHWTPSRSSHFESDARAARYKWLAEIARERQANAVAVGHNRDDQAETIIQRIIRGTGLRGLGGMPTRRPLAAGVELIRPLLGVSRISLREHLKAIGQDWREDATNADTQRQRARIRHDLLPLLVRDLNPNVVNAIARLGRLARASCQRDEQRWQPRIEQAIFERSEAELVLDRAALARRSEAVRAEWIRIAWRLAGWPEGVMDQGRWRRLARLAGSSPESARMAIAGKIEARVEGDRFRLIRQPSAPSSNHPLESLFLETPGFADWRDQRVFAQIDSLEECQEILDRDRLQPPLIVRAPRSGDRFDPLGMQGQSKPLSDYLRGRKVARESRPFVPLVCDALGIIWVVGAGICDRARVRETTVRRLGLRAAKNED